jgi:ABC-type glutathione transport system ATPase component
MPGMTDDEKKKDAARKAEQAAIAKEKKNAEKNAKQKARDDEQRAKSQKNDKTKPTLTGLNAVMEAEKMAAEAEAAMSRRAKRESDLAALDTRGAANGKGDELIFEKKLSKEEKKAAAAAKRGEKSAMKGSKKGDSSNSLASMVSEDSSGDLAAQAEDLSLTDAGPEFHGDAEIGSGGGGGGAVKSFKKKDKAGLALERVAKEKAAVEAELEAAREASSKSRTQLGSYKGALEAAAFTLANPGGGANLLEDAACTLVRGRCYGLIGRNGKGKSTMLRALAARRVGAVPPNVVVWQPDTRAAFPLSLGSSLV